MPNKKQWFLSIAALCSATAWAEESDETAQIAVLPEIEVRAEHTAVQSLPLQTRKAGDVVIGKETLQKRSALLGEALAGQPGVHGNPFGGGANAPIIRGQEGVRLKILQNGADVVDMSHLSPDHASAADTLLAEQVEIIRGAPTLLYSSASPEGVVNVVDKRIPEKRPEKGYEAEIALRHNTNSHEKLVNGGATLGLGRHVALRLEGLQRSAGNYHVPEFKLGNGLDYVPDTFNKSRAGTIGLSFVGEKGYLGAAYSLRRDKYGLPGHNHNFDKCIAHLINPDAMTYKPYLRDYPHLMSGTDLSDSPHFHCGTNIGGEHKHDHDHPYGHNHDHTHAGPWVDLVSKRTDLRGEFRRPFAGVEKIRITAAFADYYHDEKDAGKDVNLFRRKDFDPAKNHGRANNIFINRNLNTRLELTHAPVGTLKGVWGVQYQGGKSNAHNPYDREASWPLVENKDTHWSVFGLEQFKHKNFLFELGARAEKQKIHVTYDYDLLKRRLEPEQSCVLGFCFGGEKHPWPDLSDYRQKAFSYSGTVLWDFHPDYRLSLALSHNERLPSPMELYYHGKHLATNSFETGNKELEKERSDNFELGLTHQSDRVDYRISAYYNRFKNYIYKEPLYREGNLYINRYVQSKAHFYGVEGEIGYRPVSGHQITLFGDYIRGRLTDLPGEYKKIYTGQINPYTLEPNYIYGSVPQADQNAPRVPPTRLGVRLNSKIGSSWQASAEYTRVFSQRKTGKREDSTRGYNLLNFGLDYRKKAGGAEYGISLNANNVLNQKIYIHTSFLPYVPQMGRNFSIGVNAKF